MPSAHRTVRQSQHHKTMGIYSAFLGMIGIGVDIDPTHSTQGKWLRNAGTISDVVDEATSPFKKGYCP